MNTRFLETLIVLARVGSFREAAEAMHVTQTAVSQRIANLEDDLGIELIDRSARQLKLTPHGQEVVEQSRKIVALTKGLHQLSQRDAPVAGPVRIGAVETVVKTWLSPLIKEISTACPLIDLEIAVDTSRNLQDMFVRRSIDVMFQDMHFTPATETNEYVVRRICDYPVHWISRPELCSGLPRAHALKEIVSHRILTFSRFSLPHANLQAFLMDHGLENARITNVPSVESILQLLHDGYAVAAIPPVFVIAPLLQGGLTLWDCPAPLPITMLGIARRGASAGVLEVLRRAQGVAHAAAERVQQEAGQPWMCSLAE